MHYRLHMLHNIHMTSFVLKLIAALSMLLDHIGVILFPDLEILRILGRLACPIYAFCIAEGFRYTRDRRKYFLRIFILGLLCQIVYTIVDHQLYLGILITFSISILLMAALYKAKTAQNDEKRKHAIAVFCAGVLCSFVLTYFVAVDYGFFGIMLPVCAYAFDDRWKRLAMFTACLIALAIAMAKALPVQYWSLAAVPLLALYNGQPGRVRLKYFFYIFYPLHLAVLYGISMLMG